MPLRPVEKALVSQGILEQIREMICSGEFLPGQRLPSETSMAENLSVGRSSLREALNALVYLGYLRRESKGVCVAPEIQWPTNFAPFFSRAEGHQKIAEMIEVRKIIEAELAALAAKRGGQDDVRALEEIIKKMEAQLNDPERFIESDQDFHLCVAKAAKNGILIDFGEKLRDLLRDNISLIVQQSNISREAFDYHQRIFEAIRDHDSEAARRIMEAHITVIEEKFMKILRGQAHGQKESSLG